MDKSKLSETDICEKFISPALAAAGWNIHAQILREYPLRPGRMVPPEPHPDDADAGFSGEADAPSDGPSGEPIPVRRYIVSGSVTVSVARERVQYLNAQGKLITESLRDYTRINVKRRFDSLDAFLQAWSDARRKAVLIDALEVEGVLFDALAEEVGKDLDPFDLLLHVAYDMPPLTRRERASRVAKRNAFTKYGEVARKVIDALIDKYVDEGVQTIESMEVLKVPPLDKLGTPSELVKSFGGRPQYDAALRNLERELYRSDP